MGKEATHHSIKNIVMGARKRVALSAGATAIIGATLLTPGTGEQRNNVYADVCNPDCPTYVSTATIPPGSTRFPESTLPPMTPVVRTAVPGPTQEALLSPTPESTRTPAPTASPTVSLPICLKCIDLTPTVEAILTSTAEAALKTPTITRTPAPTSSPTVSLPICLKCIDLTPTVEAILTSTAEAALKTPTITRTPTPPTSTRMPSPERPVVPTLVIPSFPSPRPEPTLARTSIPAVTSDLTPVQESRPLLPQAQPDETPATSEDEMRVVPRDGGGSGIQDLPQLI